VDEAGAEVEAAPEAADVDAAGFVDELEADGVGAGDEQPGRTMLAIKTKIRQKHAK
jgi:hypothetical protein